MEVMTRAVEQNLDSTLDAAAAGDEAAFARIVGAYHDDMRRVCIFVARDDAVADDAVQAAWAIAWRKLGSVREPDRLRPWLVSIAVNEAKKLLKKRKRRSEAEVPIDAARVAGSLDPASSIDAIDTLAAMDRLDPEDRALLAMRYAAGFDATELSEAIGLSPSGTRTRLERLLARLRKELTDD